MNLNLDWRKMGWFLKAKAKLWRAKFHFCPWVGPKEQLTVTSVNRYLHIKAESVDERQDLGIRSILLSVCSPRNIDQSHLIGLWLHAGRNAISETIDYGLFNCLTITGNTEEKSLGPDFGFLLRPLPQEVKPSSGDSWLVQRLMWQWWLPSHHITYYFENITKLSALACDDDFIIWP